MKRHRRKKLKYGLFSGVIAFAAGWAVSIILIPETPFPEEPRWRSTLWLYLGFHGIPLSDIHLGGMGFDTKQPAEMVRDPGVFKYAPLVVVGCAGAYTTGRVTTRGIKNTISNALTAGSAYFLSALIAIVATDMRPSISLLLVVGGVIAGAAWLGSSFLGTFTRGVPFVGITSLGTLITVGFLLIAGGSALVAMLWELIVISYAGPAVAGILIGAERSLRYDGKGRNPDWPRLASAKYRLRENWLELVISAGVVGALYLGLTNAV
jgi:hypothetical protein